MVYIDSKGFRVEIVPSSPEGVVSFYPQGGGFQRTLPVIVFEALYKPESAPPAMRRAIFSGDWMDETWPGFTDGMRWNGWAMPLFEFETASKIFADIGNPSEFWFDSEKDAFVYANPDFPDEPEIFGASFIEVEGRTIKAYGVGAGSWCWYERGNDE